MTFATNLLNLRKKHKMSQGKLAALIGVSQTAIANYESGSRFPNQEILLKIADAFNVSIDFLFGRATVESAKIDDVHRALIQSLLRNDVDKVYKYIQASLDIGIMLDELAENVLSPVLHSIGDMWEHGKIEIYQEHIASECLMNAVKLLKVESSDNKNSQNILVFTARKEKHSLPARVITEVLKQWGHKVYYMRELIPVEHLVESVKSLNIDTLIISTTIEKFLPGLRIDLEEIVSHKDLKNIEIIVGGHAAEFLTPNKKLENKLLISNDYNTLRGALKK